METKNWKETLSAMSRRIDEDRAFLQSYMLDPCLDNRPAEEERLKDIIALADEMEEILTDLIEKGGEAAVSLDTDGSDINIEYKTHTLGRPDGEDNIDGDWELSEEEMYPAGEELTLPEEESSFPPRSRSARNTKKARRIRKRRKTKSKGKGDLDGDKSPFVV